MGAPEANAYEFQSRSIIDMLDKLMDKFTTERAAAEKTERDSREAFEKELLGLKHDIQNAADSRDEKAKVKAQSLQAKADAAGDLTSTTDNRDADVKYVDDLIA